MASRTRARAAAEESTPKPEKKQTELEKAMAEIREHKGVNAISMANNVPLANSIPTDCFLVDYALFGGLPEGYATMLYGFESSGKSTMAQKVIAGFQRKYGRERKAAYLDPEGLYDPNWARQLGGNPEDVVYSQPATGEETVDILASLMDVWEIGLIVLDSIPSCVPMAIRDKSAEDSTMTELARLMGKMCSKILSSWATERRRNHRVTVLLLNQFRMRVGGLILGDPRTLPGGRQINHIPSTKIELKNKQVTMKGVGEKAETDGAADDKKEKGAGLEVDYNEHSFKLTKHKHGASLLSGDFRMVINESNELGLPIGSYDDTATVATFAKRCGLITGGGSSWKIDGVSSKFSKLFEIQKFFVEHPDEYLSMKQRIIAQQRQAKGLPMLPPDNFLLDWAAES